MPEEKTENRFVGFFERNRKIFLPFKYFVYLIGVVVIILFILDSAFRVFLEENLEGISVPDLKVYYYEPYLDFGFPFNETKNYCRDVSDDPLLIYTFGGSTMWGWGVEYDKTIPSYISEKLCREEIPIEVKNFGTPAYGNTQEIIKLFLELEVDKVPDIFIFYDGANDISAGIYKFFTPQIFEYFAQKTHYHAGIFSYLREYLSRYSGNTDSSFSLKDDILGGYFSKFKLNTDGLYGEELYYKMMENYLRNVKIVKSMEEDWGFKSFFYWQPTLYDKRKNLSKAEEVFLYKYYDLIGRIIIADPVVTEFLNNTKDVKDLREVFNNRADTVFMDWCHINSEDNKIIAEKMVEDILKYLEESNYYEKK